MDLCLAGSDHAWAYPDPLPDAVYPYSGGRCAFACLDRRQTALCHPVAEKRSRYTAAPVASLRHSFRDGLAIALLNPKIATFFASLFSQFITPGQNLLTHFTMASMAGFIDAAVYILMVYIASTSASQNWLGRYQKQIDFSFAILLLGLGLSLFISQINRLL